MRQLQRRELLLASLILATAWIGSPTLVWAQDPGQRLAFLVAVTEYRHSGLDPLEFTERDIEDFGRQLAGAGFDVLALTPKSGKSDAKLQPTAANIRTRLAEFLKSRKVSRHDLVLLGLSGHGLQPRGSGDSFFCPIDANLSMAELDQGKRQTPKEPDTLVSVGELLTTLEESGVGQKLVLVDACRNEPKSKGGKTVAGIDKVNLGELPSQTAVLLSCSRGEMSFEHKKFGEGHGAFFHSVIEGLSGRAVDDEQQVTWDSLAAYVRRRVPRSVTEVYGAQGGKQRPNLISNTEGESPVLLTAASVAKLNAGRLPKESPKSTKPEKFTEPGKVVGAKGTKAGQERDDNQLKLRLVWCPDGSFAMGSPANEKVREFNEAQVQVKLTGYWLGKYEVTQAQYERIMGKNPSDFSPAGKQESKVAGMQTGDFPVENVSWEEALEFCRKFTEQEHAAGRLSAGWEYTLPTEAQWEYACRAGTTTPYFFGGSLNGNKVNCHGEFPYGTTIQGKSLGRTTTVGSYAANNWGLHDMHGNVREWCRDTYADKLPGGTDPETKGGSHRAFRGGSWNTSAVLCRSACRDNYAPEHRLNFLGFRLALSSLE